jgi:hypothetical protein
MLSFFSPHRHNKESKNLERVKTGKSFYDGNTYCNRTMFATYFIMWIDNIVLFCQMKPYIGFYNHVPVD